MTSTRKQCSHGLTPCAPETWREALACQLQHSELTCSEIADAANLTATTLVNASNPYGDTWPSMRHLETLLRLTPDNGAALDYLARANGRVVLPVPELCSLTDAAALLESVAAMLRAVAEAHRDDTVTVDEAALIEREGRRVIGCTAAVMREAQRRAAVVPIGRRA